MTSTDRTFSAPPSTPARILVLVGYFACVAAMISALDGAWVLYRRHVMLTHWPAAVARVDACRLQRYDGLLQSSTSSFAVRCRLAYGVGAVRYVVPVRSRFTMAGVDSMASWVAAHPRGSSLLLHYDPRHASTVSLAGTGVFAEEDAVSVPFRGALVFGIPGAVLLLAGAAVDRRRKVVRAPIVPSRFRTPPVGMGTIG